MDEGLRQDLSTGAQDRESQMPLVSVIMPVYNAEKYVEAAVRSVLDSSYPNIEVIVVDDGSTDGSLRIVEHLAAEHSCIRVLHQENAGPCRARNVAVAASHGEYILPVDADDLLGQTFIWEATAVLREQSEVKVVCPTIDFIGKRRGRWNLPEFSLRLLARRNHIAACAMYRREDFDRIGGYCEEMAAREDWDFWISMLKDGGGVMTLPEVGYFYRVCEQSKRFRDRKLAAHVILMLNRRHPEFFERELGGPLRRMRSWSRVINALTRPMRYKHVVTAPVFSTSRSFVEELPWRFEKLGEEIFKNRNAIRCARIEGEDFVIKEFCLPHRFNRFVYRWLRKTKAQRSFEYAAAFRQAGIGSPEPVGYCDTGGLFGIGRCYYVSRRSTLSHDYRDLIGKESETEERALRAIALTTARMHEAGYWHKDFSGGNILWGDSPEGIRVELIDLNRMRRGYVSLRRGCANFDRLEATPRQQRIMAEAYAKARGFDSERVFEEIVHAREKKIGNL